MLSVWKFPSALDADHAELTLKRLVEHDALVVHDAAFVIWPDGAKRPRTHHLSHEKVKGTTAGSALGLVVGSLFALPVVGLAVGAVAGALKAKGQPSLDDEVVDRLRAQITPGTSAMFVVSSDAVRDDVRKAFEGQSAELLYSDQPLDWR